MPFATAKSDDTIVISYGLPFLMMFGITFLYSSLIKISFKRNDLKYIGVGLLIFLSQLLAWIHGPNLVQSGYRILPNFIGLLIFVYLFSSLSEGLIGAKQQRKIEPLLKILVASVTILAWYYIINFGLAVVSTSFSIAISQRYVGGIIGLPWGASNAIAGAMIFPLFLTIYLAISSENYWRYVYLISMGSIFLAIIMTFSRGALMSLGIGLLCLILVSDFKYKIKIIKLITFTGILVCFLNFSQVVSFDGIGLTDLGKTIAQRFSAGDIQDYNGRAKIWHDFLGYIDEHPFLGSGYYSSLYLHNKSGHNFILTTLAERGIIGLLMTLSAITVAIITVIKNLKKDKPSQLRVFNFFVLAGGTASISHLMVEDANFTQPYNIYFWIILASIFLGQDVFKGKSVS